MQLKFESDEIHLMICHQPQNLLEDFSCLMTLHNKVGFQEFLQLLEFCYCRKCCYYNATIVTFGGQLKYIKFITNALFTCKGDSFLCFCVVVF